MFGYTDSNTDAHLATADFVQKLTGAAFVVLLTLASVARADGPEIVERIPGAHGHTVWKITRPRVNQAVTDYDQIQFAPGETVIVEAGGCVQTGGQGATWKRYVDPVGKGSDRLYHGQISIPGATNGLEFFKPFQPTLYTIPANAQFLGGHAHLTLGYTDDAYADNGYAKPDNGNENQCWQVKDASVVIDISPAAAAGAPPSTASYLFTIENVVIRHLRSKHSDTDILAAGVVVDGTQSDVGSFDAGKWTQGPHPTNF